MTTLPFTFLSDEGFGEFSLAPRLLGALLAKLAKVGRNLWPIDGLSMAQTRHKYIREPSAVQKTYVHELLNTRKVFFPAWYSHSCRPQKINFGEKKNKTLCVTSVKSWSLLQRLKQWKHLIFCCSCSERWEWTFPATRKPKVIHCALFQHLLHGTMKNHQANLIMHSVLESLIN